MTDILRQLKAAKYIYKIDLSSAYNQIPLEKNSQSYTVFTVPGRGLFEFKRMPFRLTGAPATFQRLIDKVITPEMRPNVFSYLDDIIIVTETFDEHLIWLSRVLDRIIDSCLTINPDKSEFCCSEVKYLGFVVNRDGLKVDEDKVAPIVNYPVPKTVKQLRRFLGMASWYRRFIPEFATMAEPLSRLFMSNVRWQWGNEQTEAFEFLKKALTSAPILAYPLFKEVNENPFSLQFDASASGVGVMLTQKQDDEERVIAYASRTLTAAERNYTVTERECLAVVWGIRKFREYLEGFYFQVITDHSSLKWLHSFRNPTGRLAHWGLEFQSYKFDIIHRKGALHHVPDALSRMTQEDDGLVSSTIETEDSWYLQRIQAVQERPTIFPDWRIDNGKLYRHRPSPALDSLVVDLDAWKLVLPRELRARALEESHSEPQSGHFGNEKTFRRVSSKYYWPGIFHDVVSFVRACDICQKSKVEQATPAGMMGSNTSLFGRIFSPSGSSAYQYARQMGQPLHRRSKT